MHYHDIWIWSIFSYVYLLPIYPLDEASVEVFDQFLTGLLIYYWILVVSLYIWLLILYQILFYKYFLLWICILIRAWYLCIVFLKNSGVCNVWYLAPQSKATTWKKNRFLVLHRNTYLVEYWKYLYIFTEMLVLLPNSYLIHLLQHLKEISRKREC